jgi:hypothetical protein
VDHGVKNRKGELDKVHVQADCWQKRWILRMEARSEEVDRIRRVILGMIRGWCAVSDFARRLESSIVLENLSQDCLFYEDVSAAEIGSGTHV